MSKKPPEFVGELENAPELARGKGKSSTGTRGYMEFIGSPEDTLEFAYSRGSYYEYTSD